MQVHTPCPECQSTPCVTHASPQPCVTHASPQPCVTHASPQPVSHMSVRTPMSQMPVHTLVSHMPAQNLCHTCQSTPHVTHASPHPMLQMPVHTLVSHMPVQSCVTLSAQTLAFSNCHSSIAGAVLQFLIHQSWGQCYSLSFINRRGSATVCHSSVVGAVLQFVIHQSRGSATVCHYFFLDERNQLFCFHLQKKQN